MITTASKLASRESAGARAFHVALVSDSTSSPAAEAATKSPSQSGVSKRLCVKNDRLLPDARESAATHVLY